MYSIYDESSAFSIANIAYYTKFSLYKFTKGKNCIKFGKQSFECKPIGLNLHLCHFEMSAE